MSAALHIQLLGDFRVEYAGARLGGFASPRLQSLLAYLLLHRDSPTPRQQLAFLFWPDSSERQALTNLRKLLYLLHHALPSAERFLLEESRGLQWRPENSYTLDVESFEADMRRAQSAAQRGDLPALQLALEQAAQVYKGDLLPSCYDDWIIAARDQLHRSFFVGLDRLVDLLEREGQFASAIAYTRRLLQLDPLHEPTYRRLMKLHALDDDRNAVHRVYRECVKILRREFDVEPNRATQLLYRRLTATSELRPLGDGPRERSPDARPPTNVSVPPTSFLGREQELAGALRLLRAPSVRLLTITGAPGIGKTRLAAEVALRLQDDFPDGVFFVDLAPTPDPVLVLPVIAETLGLPATAQPQPAELLYSHLRDKQMLLLLDNLEHLLAAATSLSLLLRASPSLKLLITSRIPLRIRGENELRLSPLSLPLPAPATTAEQVAQSAAARLFVERAQVARPSFALTEQNAAIVAEIVRRLDGLPLAIEWAANRVKFLPPEVMLPRLQNRLQLLVQGARDLSDRQQSLRGAAAWSYDLLSDGEQRLFRRLSVFAGGCDVAAAEAVCNPGNELGIDVVDELMALADKSLLQQKEMPAPQQPPLRFDMLETIREYALERLEQSGEAAQLFARHAAYYLDLQRRAEAASPGSEAEAAAQRLALEQVNIRAAQVWAAMHRAAHPS